MRKAATLRTSFLPTRGEGRWSRMSIETVVDFGANGAAWKPFDDGQSGTRCALPERLSIAQVAPLYESVPPKLYGGTERVVSYLTDELVSEGHDEIGRASCRERG